MMRRMTRASFAILPVLALALPLALAMPAAAVETIHPTTTADIDPAAADCAPGHTLPCSLRAAVLRANTLTGAVIQLDAGTYVLNRQRTDTDDGNTGDLEVRMPMTIQGAGVGATTIRANNDPGVGSVPLPINDDRVIEIESAEFSPNVTIADLRITGGRAPNDGIQGAEADGGGIYNDNCTLTVHNVMVDHNSTQANQGSLGNGGGLGNVATVTVQNSTFAQNVAAGDGGGIWTRSSSALNATFANLLVTGNQAQGIVQSDAGGGGIYNQVTNGGTASFTDIMITGNAATHMSGGGVYDESSTTTPVVYNRVTISGNTAVAEGGGFYSGNSLSNITNSTITGNTQAAGQNQFGGGPPNGGGLAIGESGTVHLNNDTISDNRSDGNGGGLWDANLDVITVHNTLVVNNKNAAGALSNCQYTNPPNVGSGSITTQGHNIANDTTCNLVDPSDRQGAAFNPNLGVLGDNSGPRDGAPTADSPTLTRALPTGSIAINTADNTNCPAVDERGITRPQQATCDVGAYEFVLAVPSPTPALPKAGSSSAARPDPRWPALVVAVLALAAMPLLARTRRTWGSDRG